MKTAEVIIGANFGDEGKGLFTDYQVAHCAGEAVVVRFNGGAQAGHTVTTPDGARHVFSHFGAGTLQGAATYLSRFFACNPLLFLKEYRALAQMGVQPVTYVDAAAALTTPYDMMINQIVEDARGQHRHGSVGVGFGETIERQEASAFPLCVADALNKAALRAKLVAMRAHWVPQRLRALGVEAIPPEWQTRLQSEVVLQGYIEATQEFMECVELTPISRFKNRPIVFEGAQGLLLDQRHRWFPHVTRSNTGLQNVLPLAQALGLDGLNITYASRAYLTRHGAGPLPHELPGLPCATVQDLTNVPHPYQGRLRYAWLDIDMLAATIAHDLQQAKGPIALNPGLGLSCLDQVADGVQYYAEEVLHEAQDENMVQHILSRTGFTRALLSYGPTRATVQAAGRVNNFSINRAGQNIGLSSSALRAVVSAA